MIGGFFMTKKPLVSVTMPAYNAEHYIGRAIESILNQSFKNFELIIANDASTDGTLAIIRKYQRKDKRIRIINNKKNLQIAASLNKSVSQARADVIARMDADDVSMPTRLEEQYKILKQYPKVAIVGTDIIVVNKKGIQVSTREYPTSDVAMKKIMYRYSPFAHPVVMFRKNVFEEFGGYDTKLVPCEDIDLWFKIGSKYKFKSIHKSLLQYTLINTSNSNKKLRPLEILTLKIRFNAFRKYDYNLDLYDVIYNLGQLTTLFITPPRLRVWIYNFLRSRKVI